MSLLRNDGWLEGRDLTAVEGEDAFRPISGHVCVTFFNGADKGCIVNEGHAHSLVPTEIVGHCDGELVRNPRKTLFLIDETVVDHPETHLLVQEYGGVDPIIVPVCAGEGLKEIHNLQALRRKILGAAVAKS